MLQRNSPQFLSSTRIRAAIMGKGGQRVPVLWEELEVPQGWVWCCCGGWAAEEGCEPAWSLGCGHWAEESGSESWSHILRTPDHLQTPCGITMFTDTHLGWCATGGNTKSLSLVILFWVIILFSKCLIQQLQFHFRCSLQVTINPWLLTDGTLHSHLSLSSKHFTKNRNSSSIPWGSQHYWDLLPAQPAAWQSWEQHGHSSYGICWEESTGNGLGCCFEALLFCAVHQWWSWLKVQYPDPATLEKSESPALGNFCRKAQNSLCLFYTLVPRDPLQRCNLSALGGIF